MSMFEKTAYRLFGNLIAPHIDYFDTQKDSLKKAGMKIHISDYIPLVMFYSLIVFLGTLISGSVLFSLVIPFDIYNYTLSIILSFALGTAVFFTGLYYPSIIAKNIESKINKGLPFAIFYMATIAASGTNPVEMFRILSKRKGVMGKEAAKIYTDVKSLGMNLTDAIKNAATRSPSRTFTDLMWGMNAVLTTGGSLESYLRGKSKTAMNMYRRMLEDYGKTVALYTEIYVTLVLVGSLFFIVLMSILSPIAGSNILVMQTFIAFFLIPMVSAGFIVLIKGISPEE